ncbi:epoxide hydrolase [Caballeronia sp. LP003]|uniref:epoxide hydrolase family protein n=1 Tax=Caballeronia sp. LP003 TaxID=3038551 RepID=UPI00285EA125|nr:epoxide hydrolase [Caballeronia sp. LP003]MDR5785270.1 epoxide hydrolase [Caballeronia sp. LP003]
MSLAPHPFQLRISDEVIDDLKERLRRARYPDKASAEPWVTGTDLNYLKSVVETWSTTFNWRRFEEELNAYPQFTVDASGTHLHYLKVEGQGPNPMPLLLLHGWPGSIVEFLDLIPLLTDPGRFGGDPRDAMTLVIPSLPGYGLSFRRGEPRRSVPDMAGPLAELMRDVLGFDRFGVQGGDWGSGVATIISARFPELVIGTHLNFLMAVSRDAADYPNPTPEETEFLAKLGPWTAEEGGYQHIQGTRPQTLAYALQDSPVGLAAWILEKFRAWSDCNGKPDSVIPLHRILENITLYWVTGSINSSFWPYYASRHGARLLEPGQTVDVPVGYAEFPKEVRLPPRSAAVRTFTDIRRWKTMPSGGHFAALEQPTALAEEIRAFFRSIR